MQFKFHTSASSAGRCAQGISCKARCSQTASSEGCVAVRRCSLSQHPRWSGDACGSRMLPKRLCNACVSRMQLATRLVRACFSVPFGLLPRFRVQAFPPWSVLSARPSSPTRGPRARAPARAVRSPRAACAWGHLVQPRSMSGGVPARRAGRLVLLVPGADAKAMGQAPGRVRA